MNRVAWGVTSTVLVIAVAIFAFQPESGAAVVSAADRTAEAGSFRVRMTHQYVPSDGGEPGGRSWSAEGTIDYRTGHGLLTLDVAGEGAGELRLVGDQAFLRMDGMSLGGRPWMEIDLEQRDVPSALHGLNLGGNDPRALVDALAGAGGKVDKLGSSTILGEEVIRYQGSVDLKSAADRSGGPGERVDQLAEQTGLDSLGLEAWIDEVGRARRLVYYIPPSASAASDAPSSTLDIQLSDFGVTVDVERPPAAEVTVFGELDPD